MPQNLTNIPLVIKILAVILGAIFALTLTGDIDRDGRLRLSFGVAIKFAFSAYFGFLSGAWVIDYFELTNYGHASHGFIMMLCSVFGMTLVGIAYQAIKLSTTNKTPSEIASEIKATFKAIFN